MPQDTNGTKGDRRQREIEDAQRRNFGERYIGASLSQIIAPEWVQSKINDFLKKKKDFLVYCGNPGVGKTYFCASIIEHILENFRTFRYWKEQDLYRKLRECMDQLKGDYLEMLKYLIDDELVIIDDIGSQGLTDWRKEILFDAIDARYNSMKPTIITSNLTKEEFYKCFHSRLCSRVFAKDNIIIELEDIDHRA